MPSWNLPSKNEHYITPTIKPPHKLPHFQLFPQYITNYGFIMHIPFLLLFPHNTEVLTHPAKIPSLLISYPYFSHLLRINRIQFNYLHVLIKVLTQSLTLGSIMSLLDCFYFILLWLLLILIRVFRSLGLRGGFSLSTFKHVCKAYNVY